VCEEDVLNREKDEEGRVIVGSSFFVNEASQEGRTDHWTSGESEMQQRGACARGGSKRWRKSRFRNQGMTSIPRTFAQG
jgi:hypothetical protein